MIVDDRNVICVAIAPSENQSPLPIDTNRMKSGQAPRESLKVIARRAPELIELNGRVEHVQLSERNIPDLCRDAAKSAGATTVIQGFRGGVAERSNHVLILMHSRHPCKADSLLLAPTRAIWSGAFQDWRPKCLRNSSCAKPRPAGVRTTDFALPLGSSIQPRS